MGFQLDIKTLVYVFIFGNLFILLLITNYRSNVKRDTASTLFIRAKIAQLLFWCSLLLWNHIPSAIVIVLSNALVLVGCCLEITALLLMMGVPGSRIKLYYITISISSSITFCIVALFFNNSGLRIAFTSLWSILFVIYPSYHLTANKKGTPLQKILGLLFFAFALIMLVRAIVALVWVPEMTVFTTNLSQYLYYLGMYLLLIVGAAGFILLSNEHSYIKLKRIASYDDLTGILNRGPFFQDAELMFEKAVFGQEYISFLQMDLDHFKEVNDTYGHDTGDMVLEHFASTIKANLENGDLLGRLGGEEFAVILLGPDEESCDRKAEALREAVMRASTQKISLGYTVSIGVITIIPDLEDSIDKLYKLSDKALYQAKLDGRNRVIRYR
ncbi:diguanylate cyclase [Paenibacillus sp. FSL R10-2734]|uniref:GGDEF domain-containing protein n=1 Tax=Paenibacillus sp. FSL R10-2734 TaxID=2954691 RepID=UPI0030DDA8C0